jgi:TatD DNase family protein
MYIDTHAHLSDEKFSSDLPEALARAADAGIERILEVGCDPRDWEKSLKLAKDFPGTVRCILGLHPQQASQATDDLFARLASLAAGDSVVGIGETGLDYFYEYSPREVQKDVLRRYIALSDTLGKPLVIHCRDAYADLRAVLAEQGRANFRGVIHCFSGSPEDAHALTRLGFLIGVDGPITYPSAKNLKAVIADLPLSALLLETDCPYLPPQPFRGKRNEPAYLPLAAQAIATLKGTTPDEIGRATSDNARGLFKI